MGSTSRLWGRHQFLMHQLISLPFAFLFYFLAERGYLSLKHRFLFVAVGGCALAVGSMGLYSALLFGSTFLFVLLLFSVDPGCIHSWVFCIQMLWQTFWHLLIQYREYYLHEPVSTRLFVAVSSLMLLTQKITSLSLDIQEGKVVLNSPKKGTCVMLLPLISYIFNFTTLLGGPLCSYTRFVSHMEEIHLNPPPRPVGVVLMKIIQVVMLELVRYCLVCFMNRNLFDPLSSSALFGILWIWGLALVLRIQYYSHWRISECLINAAGFGFWAKSPGDSPDWSGITDGDFWTTETSTRVSEFARRWNATTASWLRRLVYIRCKRFPLFMTFGFSLWWHGLHAGHFVGFLGWAAMVKADHYIHKILHQKLCRTQVKLLYTCLGWINTQMVISSVVVAVELRTISSLRLLIVTHIALFPLCNIILFVICRYF